MKKWQIWLLLVSCNLFWAGNYVFGKYVVAELTPLLITFSRWILALFLLFPIAHYMERPDWSAVKKDWVLLLSMGILGVGGYNVMLYSALAYTTPTNAALVSALNPGVIVIFSIILLKERILKWQVLGIFVSLAGTLVVLTNGDWERLLQAKYNVGDLMMLGAVVVWTLYSLIVKRLSTPPITATAVSTAMAVVLLTPFVVSQFPDTAGIGWLTVIGIFYMVLFPSVGSFVFWNISMQGIGASEAGVSLNLIPVFTAMISSVLGEQITTAQVFGGLLVFCGVVLTTGLLERKRLERTKMV